MIRFFILLMSGCIILFHVILRFYPVANNFYGSPDAAQSMISSNSDVRSMPVYGIRDICPGYT